MNMPERPERPIGSLWTVDGVEPGLVLVLVGPFAATPSLPEYVVAPVYTGREPGFRQTDEDVALSPAETGLPDTSYAAIWNAGPALARDLVLLHGLLPDDAIRDVRDVYWCGLNERPLHGPRLGRPVHSRRDPVRAFQGAELDRWRPLSARVFQAVEDHRAARERDATFATVQFDAEVFSGPELAALLQADPRTIFEEFSVTPVLERFGPLEGSIQLTVPIGPELLTTLRAAVNGSTEIEVEQLVEMGATAANADYALAA